MLRFFSHYPTTIHKVNNEDDDDDDDDNMGSAGMVTSAVIRKDVHDKGTSSKVTGKRHASSHGIEEHDLDDVDDNTGFSKRSKTRKR